MKKIFYLAIFGLLQFSCQNQQKAVSVTDDPTAGIYEGIEFDMPRVVEPVFKNNVVNIRDFGAVSDGLTKNTEAFAAAIDALFKKGGGKLLIPRGIWLTGPIILKSNINVHAEDGALILFSRDFDDYPLIKTSFEGLNTYRCTSPIQGNDLENIAFTGKGVFDGNGDAWRKVKKSKMTDAQWKKLVSSGGVLSDDGKTWYPTEKSKMGDSPGNFNVPDLKTLEEHEAIKDYLRPVMVSLVRCKKVLFDGPTFQNSPAWNLHPLMCEDVTIRNTIVRNPWYSQNGDGLDLESCKNVLIYNNNFDVGDDAICFKSGKDEDGRERGMPTENVIVKNNIVYHGHGGFVVGSEMSGGVRNVHVSNCTFMGTDVGLRFKSTRGRGGVVENIYISNIDMINIPTQAISFNLFYGGNSPVLEDDQSADTEKRKEDLVPVTEKTPAFRNIYMKNIVATGSGEAAIFQGLPEMNLQNVKLENAVLEAKKGVTCIDADGIELVNVKILHEKGQALTIYNSKNININGFAFNEGEGPVVKVLGNLSSNIKFDRKSFINSQEQIYQGKDLHSGVIELN